MATGMTEMFLNKATFYTLFHIIYVFRGFEDIVEAMYANKPCHLRLGLPSLKFFG